MKNRYSMGLRAITVIVGLLLLLVAPVLGSAILMVVATRWLTRDDAKTWRSRAGDGNVIG